MEKLRRELRRVLKSGSECATHEAKLRAAVEEFRVMREQAHLLAVRVPEIIAAQLADHPRTVRRVQWVLEINPRTEGGLHLRWKRLLPVWKAADRTMARLDPPQPPITRQDWDLTRARRLVRGSLRAKAVIARARIAAAVARESLRAATRRLEGHTQQRRDGKKPPPR